MKSVISKLLVVAAALTLPLAVSAQEGSTVPFQFSVFDANVPEAENVKGVHLSLLYGKTGDVTGWDFPLLAYSDTNDMKGLSFTPFLFSASNIRGEMTGVTFGLFTNQEGQSTGLNLNALNLTSNVKGLNWAVANIGSGYTMADVGLFNLSEKSNFQLAAVNVTDELDGLQLGLINCAKNGFLPCFILFNFGTSD